MNKKTLKALQGSIQKWERIRDGKEMDYGPENCPLCKVFFKSHPDPHKRCFGCPVSEYTGQKYCEGTPYLAFCNSNCLEGIFDGMHKKPESTKNAQAMVDFLKELLPKKPARKK